MLEPIKVLSMLGGALLSSTIAVLLYEACNRNNFISSFLYATLSVFLSCFMLTTCDECKICDKCGEIYIIKQSHE